MNSHLKKLNLKNDLKKVIKHKQMNSTSIVIKEMPKKFTTKDHAFWLRYTNGKDQLSLIHRLTCGPTIQHSSTAQPQATVHLRQ